MKWLFLISAILYSFYAAADTTEPFFRENDLFVSGEGGYDTYRIPALVVTNDGTVLAFCEGRRRSSRDSGDIDLLLKRSTDGGVTWSGQQVLYEEGGDEDITIGNPCPVIDANTGFVWLFFTRNNDDVLVTHSEDDGNTWDPPEDLTRQLKAPEQQGWYATGPGHGIQLRFGSRKGRLVVPTYASERVEGKKRAVSFFIYSDDHGASWHTGGRTWAPESLKSAGGECLAIEKTSGEIYLTVRTSNRGRGRAYALSQDGGDAWQALQFDEALPAPGCQASIVRYSDALEGERNVVLFANPAGAIDLDRRRLDEGRYELTIRVSYDDAATWPTAKLINDERASYSDLAVLPGGTILCLYERGQKNLYESIRLAHLNLAWLESPAETAAGAQEE